MSAKPDPKFPDRDRSNRTRSKRSRPWVLECEVKWPWEEEGAWMVRGRYRTEKERQAAFQSFQRRYKDIPGCGGPWRLVDPPEENPRKGSGSQPGSR